MPTPEALTLAKTDDKKHSFANAAANYTGLLTDIKQRIRTAQVRTAMASNASMLMLYWEIGGVLAERQKREGWGAGVLPRLAVDLHNELPDEKGFSELNLKRMVQFFREYPSIFSQLGHGSRPNWRPLLFAE